MSQVTGQETRRVSNKRVSLKDTREERDNLLLHHKEKADCVTGKKRVHALELNIGYVSVETDFREGP